MKRYFIALCLICLNLQAQTGETALMSAETAQTNDWPTIIFSVSTLVCATAGIVFVSMYPGAHAPNK